MSLIANIASVATDFATHPFSETEVTRLYPHKHKIVLDKSFASPTVTHDRSQSAQTIPLDAGNDLAGEVAAAGSTEQPQPPRSSHGMPAHKIALWFFIVLTVGCLTADVALAFITDGNYTAVEKEAIGLLDWGFKVGIGAIAGVLTGKASSLPDA